MHPGVLERDDLARGRGQQQLPPHFHFRRPPGPHPLRMALSKLVNLRQRALADHLRAVSWHS